MRCYSIAVGIAAVLSAPLCHGWQLRKSTRVPASSRTLVPSKGQLFPSAHLAAQATASCESCGLSVKQAQTLAFCGTVSEKAVMSHQEALWEQRFDELEQFKNLKGHCVVPQQYAPNPQLGRWVNNQRCIRNMMTQTRKRRLKKLGFVWEAQKAAHEALWEQRFNELEQFKNQQGHCLVPQQYAPNPQLGTWVSTQRGIWKNMTPMRKRRLKKLGFVWEAQKAAHEAFWEQRFNELEQFKNQQGHCVVPQQYAPNPQLGTWVHRQRRNWKNMTPMRKRRLIALGFVSDAREALWEQRFNELEQFKNLKGHCVVPRRYAPNPQLGRWVSKQRYRQNMTQRRERRLSELGFWET